ncbi:MAG: hypothetical protein WBA74_11815 [Cyclobacteriaceae bacterium]
MKKSFWAIILILITVMILPDISEAQSNKYRRKRGASKARRYKGGKNRATGRFRPYAFVGASLNAGNYFGDLAPVNKAASTDISFTRPGFGFFVGSKVTPNISLVTQLNWVRLIGSDFSSDPFGETTDAARYSRNLSFRNDLIELSVIGVYDIIKNVGSSNRRVAFTPYVYLGVGVFYHNPKGKVPDFDTHNPDYNVNDPISSPESARFDNAGDWVALRPFGTEGQNIAGTGVSPYSLWQINIPFGVGVRLRLPNNFDASIEFGPRKLFTDYIDDVSGEYISIDRYSDPLARAFVERSIENIDVVTGEPRNMAAVASIAGGFRIENDVRFRSSFGSEGDIRGNPDDNDLYFVTQIKLSYIFNGTRRTAKFR